MAKYQIRFIRDGGGSYEYFVAEPDTAPAAACEKANDYLRRRRATDAGVAAFFSPFRPVKTATVVEYDSERKSTKKNGHKFKIKLRYLELRFAGGGKRRDEWYAPEAEG